MRLDNLEDRAETAKALIPVFLARCMECQNWRPVSQFDANYLAVFAVSMKIEPAGKRAEPIVTAFRAATDAPAR